MNKRIAILIFFFLGAFTFSQAQSNNSKVDSAFIINNMVDAVQKKNLILIGEELHRMKFGKIKFDPSYIHFFEAMRDICSFKLMDSTSIGPLVLIDSAVLSFNKALSNKLFKPFTQLEISNPENGILYCIDVMNRRGKGYFDKGDWLKSIEAYEKGLSINNNYTSAMGAALSCMKKEYYALSIKYFMKAIELNKDQLNPIILLSEAYIKNNQIDSAKKIIDSLFPIYNDSITFLTQAYNVYNIKNDTNSCIMVLTKISGIQPNNPEIFYNLGVMYEKKGNIKQSELNYKNAIKISPQEFKYNFNLAVLYFNRYSQLSNDIALKQNLEHYNLDEKHLERISWISKAKPFINVCLNIQPNNSQILTILYYYYLTFEETENAQKTLKRIEELKK